MDQQLAINRILAATDFSESATGALEYGKLLAQRFGAHMTLLHAMPRYPVVEPLPIDAVAMAEGPDDRRTMALYALEAYRTDLLKDFPETHVLLTDEDPAPAIVASARAHNADLIVMGTRGHAGIRRALLGSVAEEVIRHSDRPVLTVRRPEHRPEWSRIDRIVCPLNYSVVALKAFRHAMLLASGLDAELTVLSLEERDWNGDLEAESERLKLWISDVPLSIRATFLIRHGEAAMQVNDFALHHGTDLIVMGAQKRRHGNTTVIGSTTEKLTRHAPCPVLTVPADSVSVEELTHAEAGGTVERRY